MDMNRQIDCRPAFRAPARGFTLIELMVALVVLAILLTLGIPSFRSTLERTRTDAAVQRFEDAIQFARLEALSKNASVSVLPAATEGWPTGVAVQRGTADTLTNALRVSDPIAADVTVAVTAGGTAVTRITFNGIGALEAPTAQTTITLSATGSTRTLSIAPSGRIVRAEGI
jgi:prepilin-type N-terminal cleavage/methylation domain-containing protein